MPFFQLITEKDLSEISSNALDFLSNSFPINDMKYTVSLDKKTIYFRFCQSEGYGGMSPNNNNLSSTIQTKLDLYLRYPDRDLIIYNKLKDLNLLPVEIKLYIPYINTDTREIEYTEYTVLNYNIEKIRRIERMIEINKKNRNK